MSESTDRTLGRWLDQQPGMRQALLEDPVQHAQSELMRRTLDAADRAMADEDVPEEVRRRVVNRVVWGEPEGLVDVHAQMDRIRKEVLATFDLPLDLTEAWAAIHAESGEEKPG